VQERIGNVKASYPLLSPKYRTDVRPMGPRPHIQDLIGWGRKRPKRNGWWPKQSY